MNTKTTTLFLLFILPLLSFAQTNNLSLEYSPHLSNITKIDSTQTNLKISHDVFFKYDHFISEKLSLTAKIGFTNFGYRINAKESIIDTSSNVTLTSQKSDLFFNFNYLMVNIGNSFKFKNYFISPEIGLGFLISSSSKYKKKDSIGNTAPRTRISSKGNLRFGAIPLSLSIGRKIELINVVPIIGIKAYYTRLKKGSVTTEKASIYGFGLLLGLDF